MGVSRRSDGPRPGGGSADSEVAAYAGRSRGNVSSPLEFLAFQEVPVVHKGFHNTFDRAFCVTLITYERGTSCLDREVGVPRGASCLDVNQHGAEIGFRTRHENVVRS